MEIYSDHGRLVGWMVGATSSFRQEFECMSLGHAGQKQPPGTSTILPRAQTVDVEPFSQGVSLGQLIQRHGQKDCELKVGDTVLVGCENLKIINWPIARIQEFSTGRDGRVWVVKGKIKNCIFTRSSYLLAFQNILCFVSTLPRGQVIINLIKLKKPEANLRCTSVAAYASSVGLLHVRSLCFLHLPYHCLAKSPYGGLLFYGLSSL
ncbi:DUF5641 domain-containing protein [Trichonephila clavipes]|nr:DUF5641 domain-containing protein [Trichonephila clavipes]